MDKLYKQSIGTIYSRINDFRNPAVQFDDLIGVANLAFVEAYQSWDQTKSKFNTHLYNVLTQKLYNFIKKEKKRFYREICAETFIFEKPCPPVYNISDQSKLPDQSKKILKIIFDKNEKIETDKLKITKYSITTYLRSKGWKYTDIKKGFAGIAIHIEEEITQ